MVQAVLEVVVGGVTKNSNLKPCEQNRSLL